MDIRFVANIRTDRLEASMNFALRANVHGRPPAAAVMPEGPHAFSMGRRTFFRPPLAVGAQMDAFRYIGSSPWSERPSL